jgi:hypothetical protein
MSEPVQRASGRYDEEPKREMTQGEMIDIMAQELANLPRFTAFAKVIEERNGVQTVRKCKIATRPLPLLPERLLTDAAAHPPASVIERWTIAAGLSVPRRRIEQELQARQDQWQRRAGRPKPKPSSEPPPPASEPPPTSEPPPAAA